MLRAFCEYDGKTKNYSYKSSEVLHSEIMLPENAPSQYQDRQTLWNSVEASEKQWNAQLSRGIIIALPYELPREQYVPLVREYCKEQFVSKGMCVDFAIHEPQGKHNPHAHIMLTMRAIDENGKWLPKTKKEYILDENGEKIILPSGEPKSRKVDTVDWNSRENAEQWRKSWAETVNKYFENENIDVRLDLRSYERQGLDILPTVHLGAAVTHMEQKGIKTELGEYNREIKQHNLTLKKLKQLIAKLENWLAETKEKIAKLFAERDKPVLLNELLYDYTQIRKEERRSWKYGQQKYVVLDTKFYAAAVKYLIDNGLATLDDLKALLDKQKPLLDGAAEMDKRIKKLDRAIDYIEKITELEPIYRKSKQGFKKAREKFAAEHKDEIALYVRAVRYLKANGYEVGEVEKYRKERKALAKDRAELERQLRESNIDKEMIGQICHAVNVVLKYKGEVPQDTVSLVEKLGRDVQEKGTGDGEKKREVEL